MQTLQETKLGGGQANNLSSD